MLGEITPFKKVVQWTGPVETYTDSRSIVNVDIVFAIVFRLEMVCDVI